MISARTRRGSRSRREGRRAEWLCALWLMARGYRLLGFRLRTPQAEIDLLVSKGDVVAVVEVKRRRDLAAALDAVTARQRDRLRRAASGVAERRGRAVPVNVRLDLIALAPGRWPRHIPDAWRES